MAEYVSKQNLQQYATESTTKYKTIFATKNEVGSPLVAATAAAMTDTTKIYVYVGSEAGYTNGHWYYYDGTSWADGGVYQSAGLVTDTTLSIAGMAADAKAVGDMNVLHVNGNAPYQSNYTGAQIDTAVGAALNPDTTLTQAGELADAKAVGDKIGDVNREISEFKEQKVISIDLDDEINGFILKSDCYVSVGGDDEHLYLNAHQDYKTYYIITTEPTEIYIGDNVTINFLDLGIMENVTMTEWEQVSSTQWVMRGTDAVRYRKSNNDLPTSLNPLSLDAHTLICVTIGTVATGKSPDVNISSQFLYDIRFSDLKQTTGNDENIPMSQKATTEAIEAVSGNDITVTINSASSKTIKFGKYTTDFNYYDYNGSRQHAWNFATGIYNGENVVVPTGTDIIGVLKEANEADFMGGVHGDETNVYTKMYMDGVEVTGNITGKSLDIIMYSHLTRVSTGDQIIDRFVHINIKDNVITIENTFKCLVDGFNLELAYNGGLFAWYLDNAESVWINDRYYDLSNPATISLTPTIRSFTVALDSESAFTVENLIGYGTENYKGGLTYFSSETPKRLKVYIANDTNTTWNTGHICNGKCQYILK